MASPYGTNWTGKPELHVIRDVSHRGQPFYFFDTPENPGTQRYTEDGFPMYSEGSAFGAHPEDYSPSGYSGLYDLNTTRQQWEQAFPGVPFPDVSMATPGTGTNAQGNSTPGTFNGMEMTERGNSGHGSWMDQQGGELISDALFAGAGYAGGPLAGALMAYGLGGDTSAESQRSLRAGALGGVAASIFGTPSTSASNTPGSDSGGQIGGSTGSTTLTGGTRTDTLGTSTGGNMGFLDDYGNWVDTGTDAGLNGGGGLYGSNVDEFGNPIDSNFTGGNTNDFFNPSTSGADYTSLVQKFGPQIAKLIMGSGNGGGAAGGGIGGFLSSLFGGSGGGPSIGSTIPGMLALGYASQQPGIDTSKLSGVFDAAGVNAPLFTQAAIDPVQKNIAAGYGDLIQSQGLRGIRGSSFGNTDIANYIDTTSRTLGDVGATAAQKALGLQGGLAGNIAELTAKSQEMKNNLYGRAFDVLGRGLNPKGYSGFTLNS